MAVKYLLDTNTIIRYLNGRAPNDLILVTHNTREFQRIAGLVLEDWE